MSKKNKSEKNSTKKIQDIELDTDILEETEDYKAEISADMEDAAEAMEEDHKIPFSKRLKNKILFTKELIPHVQFSDCRKRRFHGHDAAHGSDARCLLFHADPSREQAEEGSRRDAFQRP